MHQSNLFGLLFLFPFIRSRISELSFAIIWKVYKWQPQPSATSTISPSLSQLHRKQCDNVCMMHTLNTLAICSTVIVQLDTKWTKWKKNVVRKKTRWKSLNIVLHWNSAEYLKIHCYVRKQQLKYIRISIQYIFSIFFLSRCFTIKLVCCLNCDTIPYWSMLIYTVTCCVHFSAFISFSILYVFFTVDLFSVCTCMMIWAKQNTGEGKRERELFESKQRIVYLKVLVNGMSYHHSHPILMALTHTLHTVEVNNATLAIPHESRKTPFKL